MGSLMLNPGIRQIYLSTQSYAKVDNHTPPHVGTYLAKQTSDQNLCSLQFNLKSKREGKD